MLPSTVLELRYYLAGDGKSPFESWFDDLDPAAAAKVSVALVRLGQGNTSNTKDRGGGRAVIPDRLGTGLSRLFRPRRRHAGDPFDRRSQAAAAARHRAGERVLGGLQAPALTAGVRWRR